MAINISSGKIDKAQKVVIYGVEGIGKTTLASKFPDPLFIDTEGSTAHLDVKRVDPEPLHWRHLMMYVEEVIQDPSVCGTLVLDTADWAERMCIDYVLEQRKLTSIEDAGYGKGYTYIKEEFGKLLDKLSGVTESGTNVVVTAHAQIKKFEQPDALGAYDRWELKLTRQNAPLLKEWADMVLFLNYKTMVVSPDQKSGGHAKAMGGKRVMYSTHTPAWDAKNRCGLPEEMPIEFDQIASCIPAKPGHETQPTAEPSPEEPASEPASTLDKLEALMDKDQITKEEIVSYSIDQGYCQSGMGFDQFPENYLNYLIQNWEGLKDEISVPI